MKQLAGKKIGIGRVGDPPYHMAVSLLRKYGYTARDVQWVSVGVDAATRAAALQSGQIDAALITAPAYFRLQAAGLPVLAVLLDYDDIYVSTYYLFRRDALTKERPTGDRVYQSPRRSDQTILRRQSFRDGDHDQIRRYSKH